MIHPFRRLAFYTLLLVAATTVQANVFQRWGAAGHSDRALRSQGATIAYAAPILVNGAEADLTLFSFRKPISTVFDHLRKIFELDSKVFRNGTMGMATVNADGHVLRLIVFRLTTEDQTLVFKIDQTTRQYEQSKHPPTDATVAGLPSFPSARPRFTASDKAAAMSVAIAMTTAAPETVNAFYDDALKARSWTPALPVTNARPTALRVYIKTDRLCCVLVDTDSNSSLSRITLLHKRLRLE